MLDYTFLTFEEVDEMYIYDPETGMLQSKVGGTSEYLGIYETFEQAVERVHALEREG